MMKKLLVLTAIVTLTASAIGCGLCDRFRRGALFPTTTAVAPDVICNPCDPCDPCAAPATCDPCAPQSYGTVPGAIPSTVPSPILPGPGTVTAPTQ